MVDAVDDSTVRDRAEPIAKGEKHASDMDSELSRAEFLADQGASLFLDHV